MHSHIRAVQQRQRHVAHRLKSIAADARRLESLLRIFEDHVCPVSSEPDEDEDGAEDDEVNFLANMRCGEWYLPSRSYFRRRRELLQNTSSSSSSSSASIASCCYFKSTDGHYGKWSFSTTRLNLFMVRPWVRPRTSTSEQRPRIGSVTVVVDATQHGKKYPDALSKTVPIWAAVMSLAFHADPLMDLESRRQEWEAQVRPLFPPWIPGNELDHVLSLLPTFVESFRSVEPSLSPSDHVLSLPLRIVWLHGEDTAEVWRTCAEDIEDHRNEFHTIVLVCASGDPEWQQGTRQNCDDGVASADDEEREELVIARNGWVYVPGAADDAQAWGHGLTSDLFWQHVDVLTDDTASLDEIQSRVSEVVHLGEERVGGTDDEDIPPCLDDMLAQCAIISNGVAAGSPLALSLLVWRRLLPLPSNFMVPASYQNRVAWLLVQEARLPSPEPRIHMERDGEGSIVRIEMDSQRTKFGVERAMSRVVDVVTKMISPTEGATPTIAVILVVSAVHVHLVGALCVGLRVHFEECSHHVVVDKKVIRKHQSAVADVLGPNSIVRSDMAQINRYFTSRFQ